MRWFFALAFLTGVAFAQSTQPPLPDQRGTDKAPLSVRILPSDDAKEKFEQEDRERQRKTDIDKRLTFETQRIADYTFWLGAFTLALFCAAVGQIGLFVWQLKLIRASLDDAKEAADASTRQAKVAEDSLTKLERPYVFVSNVSGITVEHQDSADGESNWLRLTYSVANYGKIPAIIKHAQAGLSVSIDPILPLRLSYHHTLMVSPILAAGEVRESIEETLDWGKLKNTEDGDVVPDLGTDVLFFWVIITYRGPFTDHHETMACWRYDEPTGRFIGPHGGDQYNREM